MILEQFKPGQRTRKCLTEAQILTGRVGKKISGIQRYRTHATPNSVRDYYLIHYSVEFVDHLLVFQFQRRFSGESRFSCEIIVDFAAIYLLPGIS